jgi:hypothetical protein
MAVRKKKKKKETSVCWCYYAAISGARTEVDTADTRYPTPVTGVSSCPEELKTPTGERSTPFFWPPFRAAKEKRMKRD